MSAWYQMYNCLDGPGEAGTLDRVWNPENRNSHCCCKAEYDPVREYHRGGVIPACDFSDIITKMAHSGLVLMFGSDTENLDGTQERTRKLSQG